MSKSKNNKVYVIGTLSEVSTQVRTTSDGREYINGKIVVTTVVNDKPSAVEFKILAFAKTKDGADNRMFQSYKTLEGMLNKRVRVSGEFREGSMINSQGAIVHFNEVYAKFINNAKSDDVDCATFEFSGFVAKGLYERKNKDDELIGYRLEVGQTNFNDTAISIIRFDVDKNDVNIAQVIEANYLPGTTVSFSGILCYTTRTETRVEEVAFGEPVVKNFVINDKVFRITGGNSPLEDDDPAAYTMDEIKQYIAAYKQADADRLAKSSTADAAPAPSSAASAMNQRIRPASLI